MLDLATLAAADTGVLMLKGPNKEPLIDPATKQQAQIVLYGPGSPEAAAEEAARNSRNLELYKSNGGKLELTPDEQDRQRLNKLVARTKSISGLKLGDAVGEDLSQAIYSSRPHGWLTDQVASYMDDWANFPPGSVVN